MKLRRLELNNIGCFGEKSFDFSDLTVVFGENRTGKSTLVYALFFALFGQHLNSGLKMTDLCRKGEKSGTSALWFGDGPDEYQLCQFTNRLPKLFQKGTGEMPWQPLSLNDTSALKNHIPLSAEIASLGSFFRESELIYFLQDMPRYNKTLLQNLVGMDEALILRSRFKKALGKAREVRKAIQNAAPKKGSDPLNLELTRRQLASAEKELRETETAYAASLDTRLPNPAVFMLLQQQHDEKQKHCEALLRQKEKLPSAAALAEQKAALESQIRPEKQITDHLALLRQRLGEYIQKEKQIRLRLERLKSLESEPSCPICGQTVTRQRISDLTAELDRLAEKAARHRKQIEAGLEKIAVQRKEKETTQAALDQVRRQIREQHDADTRLAELKAQTEGLKSDLKQFEAIGSGDLRDAGAKYQVRADIERRRAFLQKEVIRHQVAIRQYDDHVKRVGENRKHLAEAEQKVLICSTAWQAADDAIQSLGSRLLEKVRESIQNWTAHFTFLNRFDIQMTDRELLPVIQARGYQYKLNQMSKSERIFLYLMLKLAIGDALGHLGIFVLDDPADGLDIRRKQTLAYLLAEVSRRRQVIVTTNDMAFAELFPGGSRIDLDACEDAASG
ncbi:hypothetical protein DENIS_0742 [Desulfonema ishimotonii]|uniref:Rad50/SbcC-type AAA domain-containing protein n=1 Tax=Desulfonema ishimotonii TaxID=45657 RepID=A0A401FS51_9BACT|nr:AAA family ATPase [Desulfonema ishimotonii]GBC59801.1 hypothetical protein DENIS_0742 [Desulfonema ishimotonii]